VAPRLPSRRTHRWGIWGGRDYPPLTPKNELLRSNGLARHEHHRLFTLSILLRQLILCSDFILSSDAFFPPVAFDCLALPRACCVEDHRHREVKEAEAELCCRHDVAFPIAALVC
jgi:hypothetical protein